MTPESHLGELGVVCEAKGLSQEKLAALAGIHRTYIGDVERGTRNIALVNMTRIANGLGTSLSRIIAKMEKSAD